MRSIGFVLATVLALAIGYLVGAGNDTQLSADPVVVRHVSRPTLQTKPTAVAVAPQLPTNMESEGDTGNEETEDIWENNDEQAQAVKTASTLVEGALERHAWTDRDSRAFRQVAPLMHPKDRERLTKKLIVEINGDRLRVSVAGPPF